MITGSLEHELLMSLRHSNLGETNKKEVSGEDKLHAKNDDATCRMSNWNRRVCEPPVRCDYQADRHDRALDKLRDLTLRWYRSHS